MSKLNLVIKGLMILVLIILAASAVVRYAAPQNIIPNSENPASFASPEPSAPPVVKPKPVKVRYISGIIKEVRKNSIIVADSSGKDTEVNFDANTKILKGEGAGKEATTADLANGWNSAIFLSEDISSNMAQTIQMVTKRAGS